MVSSWSLVILVVLCVVAIYPLQVDGQSCSAFKAYVSALTVSNDSNQSNAVETPLSAQALFPPYTYELPATELILLDSAVDDPCNASSIATALSEKVVLLFEQVGSCSDHKKVSVAEQNGAVAVLLARLSGSPDVQPIADDNALTTSIPVRAIAFAQAEKYANDINVEGDTVLIAFDCFEDDYPTHICVSDQLGERYAVDGTYERQVSWTVFDHPVWFKDGWFTTGTTFHHYIALDDSNGDDVWFWTLWSQAYEDTSTQTSNDNKDILVFRCSVGGSDISDPTLCPSWIPNGTNESYPVLFDGDQCHVSSDDFFCISSNLSTLHNMDGTYYAFSSAAPVWYKEIDFCDSAAGILEGAFENDVLFWALYDTGSGKAMAYCELDVSNMIMNSSDAVDVNATGLGIEWLLQPQLCTEWWTQRGFTYPSFELDPSFALHGGQECTPQCALNQASSSQEICVSGITSDLHAVFEGTWTKTGVVGSVYGTPEYQLPFVAALNGPLYMWNQGELWPELPGWIMSDTDMQLSIALSRSGYDFYMYGFCRSLTNSPADCQGGWNLGYIYGWFHDYNIRVDDGSCSSATDTPTTPPVIEWPPFICLDNSVLSFYWPWFYFYGAWIQSSYHPLLQQWDISTDLPIYYKPANELLDRDIMLVFLDVYGLWMFVDQDGVTGYCAILFGETFLDCGAWFDSGDNIIQGLDFNLNCSAEDVLTKSPTAVPTTVPSAMPTTLPTTSPTTTSPTTTVPTTTINVDEVDRETGDDDQSNDDDPLTGSDTPGSADGVPASTVLSIVLPLLIVIGLFIGVIVYFRCYKNNNASFEEVDDLVPGAVEMNQSGAYR